MSLELSGTTGLKGVAGSVAAPSIVGDDTNTGISFPAADTIKFSTGGVERMQITNSGVSGTGIGGGKILQVVSETKTDTASTNSTSFVTTGLEKAITITSGSKVLVLIDLFVGVITGYSVAFQLYNGSSQVTAFQGDTRSSAIRGFAGDFITPYRYGQVSVANHFLDTPSGTSQNYKVYWRNGYTNTGADVYLNRPEQNQGHEQCVAACSTLTLMEIAV